jgi:hypothetical protein
VKARRLNRPLGIIAPLVFGCVVAVVAVPQARAGGDEREENADPRAEASERFRRGVKLYKDGDFVAALVEFKRAYELEPNYRVLYNLGQTSRELKDYAPALQAFQRYLAEGGKEIPRKREEEVRRSIGDLTDRVGTLTITTNVEGAEIQIDDVVVGVAPLEEPIVVNVGRRRVEATLTGHAPARRVLEVAGKDDLKVELQLTDLETARPPLPPPPRPRPEPTTPVAGIVALSITGACAIVTGILGGLALSARSDLADALAAFPGTPKDIQDAQDRAATFATATDVMLAVTGAAAVTTVVLFVVSAGSGSEADGSEVEGSEDRVSVSLTPALNGVWLSGSF